MAEMDLIPGDYRQDLALRRKVSSFIKVFIVMLCCIGLAKMFLTYLIWRENVQVVRLEEQEKVANQNKSKADQFRQQKRVTEQQLAALDELRGHERITRFMSALDNAYSEGIWFDNLRFMRRSKNGALENIPNSGKAGIIVLPDSAETQSAFEINQGAEIVGHAINHTVLAEFMRKLGTQPSIKDMRLIDTSTRTYTTIQVVDFKLSLEIDVKAQGQP